MKQMLVVMGTVIALGLILAFALGGFAQMGPGMMGPGYGSGMGPGMMGHRGAYGGLQYCPYCGSYIGPYGMGPGMMGPGYQGYGYQPQPLKKPLGKNDAKEILDNYVQSLNNPNLKLGKITERDTYFEAEILTNDNLKVDTILLDKNTGWMQSTIGGPCMTGGGQSYGIGPCMMAPGYHGYGPAYPRPQGTLKEKDVAAILENYVQSTRNPNLKVGKIVEKDSYFEAEILTKGNSLVDKIIIDKYTGWMRSIY